MSASGSAFWPGGSFLATCLDVWLMAQSLSQKDTWEKLGWGWPAPYDCTTCK